MPTVQSIAREVKKKWRTLLQLGALIMTIVGSFVSPPPVWDFKEDAVWFRFAQFFVTALVGLAIIPMTSHSERRHARLWWIICAIALVLGAVVFFQYQNWRAVWTVNYSGTRIVIGEKYKKDAADYKAKIYAEEKREISDEDLVMDYAGDTQAIWDKNDIQRRRLVLAGTYIFSVSVFALMIITLIQALYCNAKPKQARTAHVT